MWGDDEPTIWPENTLSVGLQEHRWDDKVQICGSLDLYWLEDSNKLSPLNHLLRNELLNTQKWYLPRLNKCEQIVLSQFTVFLTRKTRKWKSQVSNAVSPPPKKKNKKWKESIWGDFQWTVTRRVCGLSSLLSKRSSSVCAYTVSAYGETLALFGCKHTSRANLSQMHPQSTCSELGDGVTL